MSEWIRKIRHRIAYWLASDWIDDLETRLSEFLWYQTGGRMSKSCYTVQAMLSEADAFRMQECDECEYRRTTEGGLIMPKNVMCKKCRNLVRGWCGEKNDSPDPNIERDCRDFKEKTNADRIRAMTDEELACYIDSEYSRCKWCDDEIPMEVCVNRSCVMCIVEWLKQPVKED